jgi:hypothetical protein
VQALAASSETAFCTIKPVGKFHISQYSLEIDEINKTRQNADDVTETTNLLEQNIPTLDSGDDYLEAFFSLIGSTFDRLDPIDGEQQLILTLGEEEVAVTLGENKQIRFDNLEHLALLDPEDFLTMRLYANNDAANILWEYAFVSLEAAVDLNRDKKVEFISQSDYEKQVAEADANNETPPFNDKTTAITPFRFWINNDYDVVQNRDQVLEDASVCPKGSDTGSEQECEQWDIDASSSAHNSSSENIKRIESERDLEDFFPMMIRLSGNPATMDDNYYLKFSAHGGIGLNVFKGAWSETSTKGADAYIYDAGYNVLQTNVANGEKGHVMSINSGTPSFIFNEDLIEYFDYKGEGRFIVEGTHACETTPEDCYINIEMWKRGKTSVKIVEQRLYIDLHDIKDFYHHYSVGRGTDGVLTAVENVNEADGYAYTAIAPADDPKAKEQKDEHIVMVHGWRMQYSERVQFAETAFKRSYLSGYRGQFSFFSWPTEWFDKPAHIHGAGQLVYVVPNLNNYNRSENTARQAGDALKTLLTEKFPANKTHLMAHSMGNVVISEALRNAKGQPLATHYIASQAAEVADGYNPDTPPMKHRLFSLPDKFSDSDSECRDGEIEVDISWRCYNSDLGTPYDMPPNLYALNVPEQHGPTTPDYEFLYSVDPYYKNIQSAAGTIINFYNSADAALLGWELNQLTKPDTGKIRLTDWIYEYRWGEARYRSDGIYFSYPDANNNDLVSDGYYDYNGLVELEWSDEIPINADSREILSHIVPSRTKALGALSAACPPDDENCLSVIESDVPFNFGGSNQGHSSQFYKTYAERSGYWDNVLKEFDFNTDQDEN